MTQPIAQRLADATTVTMNTVEVELKKVVQWFGLDIPVNLSPFALRRIIFRAMRDMIEKGLVQQNVMTHCYPTVMRYRMAVFQPTELGDKVRIALPATINHNTALAQSGGEGEIIADALTRNIERADSIVWDVDHIYDGMDKQSSELDPRLLGIKCQAQEIYHSLSHVAAQPLRAPDTAAKGDERLLAAYDELSEIVLRATDVDPKYCTIVVHGDPVVVDDEIVLLRCDPKLRESFLMMLDSVHQGREIYKAKVAELRAERDTLLAENARNAKDAWVDRAAEIASSIREEFLPLVLPLKGDGTKPEHIRYMVDELAAKRVGSGTKCCRWLGYVQGWLVITGESTLEAEKNRNAAIDAAKEKGR